MLIKPKKEVELPKTPEKKNTFQSGNPVGKENVKKGMKMLKLPL